MEQVNEAINNVTSLIGTVLPQMESADAQTQNEVALTTSEKMLKAQAGADSDVASIASVKTEYVVKTNERNDTSTQISSKSSKSVRDIIVDVSRSISNVSSIQAAQSQIPSKSSNSVTDAVAEVPVARSRSCSSASTKSTASKTKKLTKSAEEIAEVEESSGKASAPVSHIVVSYGSAEENAVTKNTQHERWPKKAVSFLTNRKTCAAAAILVVVGAVAAVIGSAHANKSNIQAQQSAAEPNVTGKTSKSECVSASVGGFWYGEGIAMNEGALFGSDDTVDLRTVMCISPFGDEGVVMKVCNAVCSTGYSSEAEMFGLIGYDLFEEDECTMDVVEAFGSATYEFRFDEKEETLSYILTQPADFFGIYNDDCNHGDCGPPPPPTNKKDPIRRLIDALPTKLKPEKNKNKPHDDYLMYFPAAVARNTLMKDDSSVAACPIDAIDFDCSIDLCET